MIILPCLLGPVPAEDVHTPAAQQGTSTTSSICRANTRRKQSHPNRSADATDPDFQGVMFRMQGELDHSRGQCQLLVISKYRWTCDSVQKIKRMKLYFLYNWILWICKRFQKAWWNSEIEYEMTLLSYDIIVYIFILLVCIHSSAIFNLIGVLFHLYFISPITWMHSIVLLLFGFASYSSCYNIVIDPRYGSQYAGIVWFSRCMWLTPTRHRISSSHRRKPRRRTRSTQSSLRTSSSDEDLEPSTSISSRFPFSPLSPSTSVEYYCSALIDGRSLISTLVFWIQAWHV